MRLLKQKGHRCLIYATAMLLDETPEDIIEGLGHDGTRVAWPAFSPPDCYSGVHIQEIVTLCWGKGYGLRLVEALPRFASRSGPDQFKLVYDYSAASARLESLLHTQQGILLGLSNQTMHAWAWDGKIAFNPNGYLQNLDEIAIKEAWLLCSL